MTGKEPFEDMANEMLSKIIQSVKVWDYRVGSSDLETKIAIADVHVKQFVEELQARYEEHKDAVRHAFKINPKLEQFKIQVILDPTDDHLVRRYDREQSNIE